MLLDHEGICEIVGQNTYFGEKFPRIIEDTFVGPQIRTRMKTVEFEAASNTEKMSGKLLWKL